MKKTSGIFIFFILLTTASVMAQSKDSVPARKVVENGTNGDLILGKEKRKSQLTTSSQFLRQKDSSNKQTSIVPKKKKSKGARAESKENLSGNS